MKGIFPSLIHLYVHDMYYMYMCDLLSPPLQRNKLFKDWFWFWVCIVSDFPSLSLKAAARGGSPSSSHLSSRRVKSAAAGLAYRSVKMFQLSSKRLLQLWLTGGRSEYILGRVVDPAVASTWFVSARCCRDNYRHSLRKDTVSCDLDVHRVHVFCVSVDLLRHYLDPCIAHTHLPCRGCPQLVMNMKQMNILLSLSKKAYTFSDATLITPQTVVVVRDYFYTWINTHLVISSVFTAKQNSVVSQWR